MTETQVGLLYRAASSLLRAGESKDLSLLRSYYLMRCKDITMGYGLPDKHFSSKARCSKCCIEWRKDTETKIKAVKLSKKQRQRIRSQKSNKQNKNQDQKRKELLNSNEIEQICTFCKQSTITRALKPEKVQIPTLTNKKTNSAIKNTVTEIKKESSKVKAKSKKGKVTKSKTKPKILQKNEVNVYSNTAEVFSLNNTKNTLNTSKEVQKIIKNNKKKKDKFAGLCQKAVLASAKLKEEKLKQNKINLFLKPST